MLKIPGTTAVAKTAQKSIQKWLGKGSKEILEHVATEAPDLYKATAKSTLDGFGYAIDSKLLEPEDAVNIFKNADVEGLQNFSSQGTDAMRRSQMAEQLNPSPVPTEYPKAYNVTGPEGREYVHGKLSQWIKEQQGLVETGQIKKIERSEFAPEGLMIDGEERGISGISEHIRSGYKSKVKMDSLGPALERAKQADPKNVKGLAEWFDSGHQTWKETGGTQGIHPDLTFDEYRSHILRGARKADDVTSELAKELGIKLDKEHMRSLKLKGSNDPRSQVPGSMSYNRTMGKIDSFNKEVMEILGLPGSGSIKPAPTRRSAKVALKDSQRTQEGWWQSATDWVGTDGASLDDMSKWNPGDLLRYEDKLIIQQNPGKGQAKLAMQILAERQIVEAYARAGLGKTGSEKKLLGKILKHIDAETAIKKALAEAKESVPESQLEELALKYPNEKREQLMQRANKSLKSRISQSKRGINKPTLIKLDRAGNVIPPKELTEISPGVMVGPNYKPGADQALDNVLKKLAQDPSSLDSSGMGTSFNVNQMK